MTRREVRCTSCGVLNGVPRYSIRRIPQCGKCHTKLPEPNATKFLRNIYAIPRMVWLAIPVVGLIVWGLQQPTTTKVGKDSLRINHEEAYSMDGACTNWAEEFFSRMRRAEIGHYHHIAGQYLLRYAQEASWREDNRRVSNGDQVQRLAALSMKRKPSVDFSGYWQRYKEGAAN
jgi:ISXO2-like transposase domain